MTTDLETISIAERGRLYRFGQGNCPHAAQRRASRPWSVRKAVKRLLSATFSHNDPAGRKLMSRVFGEAPGPVTLDLLLKALKRDTGAIISMTEMLALQLLLQALNGNVGAMMRLTYLSDGPLQTEDEVARENGEVM
jgi:hypothetical protein